MVPAPTRTRDGSQAPAVSVVLLPRARGGPVSRSIEDAMAQRGVETEVIGPAVHDRVRLLDQPMSAHPADVVDAALAVAGADWIAFLEVGDRWHPDHLADAIARMDSAGASWFYGAAFLLDAQGVPVAMRPAPTPTDLRAQLRRGDVIGGASSVVCRRDLLTERRPFDRRLSALVLWNAWLALADDPAADSPEPYVAERYEDARAVLDVKAAVRDIQLLRAEGLLDPSDPRPLTELGRRLTHLGHARDAAKLHARAAIVRRDPRAAVRAVHALRSRGDTRLPLATPDWLVTP